MAAYEILLLNTAIPQIQAAQSGDTYVVPRDIAISAALTLSAGTANGVPYLNGSKAVTTGSALTFDGNIFAVSSNDTRLTLTSTGSGQTVGISIKGGASSGDAFNFFESLNSDGTQAWYLGGNGASNTLAFKTNGNNERFRISSDGTFRVKGAGTAGSTDAVQFSGSAPASALILDSNGKLSVDVGGTTGTTYNIIGLNGGGAIANGAITTQSTTNVANTATTILNVTNTGNMVMVTGQGSGAIFMDLLLCGYTSDTVTVITSATQQNSPAARTYTLSSGALQLQMGSATAMTVKAVNIFAGA